MEPRSDTGRPRPRRTQRERRETTRALLLESTIACLVELGYGGTTTLEIERRAGASRGARIHHFPSKAALLAASVDHLYNQLSDHYDEAFAQAPARGTDVERLRSGLRLLWSIYSRPAYCAVLELTMAARTDPELRAQLRTVADRHRELAVSAAQRYFALERAVALTLVDAIHTTLVGLLMQRNVVWDEQRQQSVLALLEEAVARHLPASPNEFGPG